jgi:hypothetical protein
MPTHTPRRTSHQHEVAAFDPKAAQQNGSRPATEAPTGVEQAFALGWHVAELYHMASNPGAPLIPEGTLPQINNLDFAKRTSLLVEQIQASVTSLALSPNSRLTTIADAAKSNLVMAVGAGAPGQGGASLGDIAPVHEAFLESLTASDFRLGKAYALGVALGETIVLGYCHLEVGSKIELEVAADMTYVEHLFAPERIEPVVRQLRDLKSAFEDHATDSVEATLLDWANTRTIWNVVDTDNREKVANHVYRQGSIWRALLSGEKEATDYLTVADYAKAIGDLLKNYTQMAAQFGLTRTTLAAAGFFAVVVVAAGFVIGYVFHSGIQGVYTAAIGLLSIFGVSSATAIAAVRNALSTTEQQLWEAELSAAIAESINWAPVKPLVPNAIALRQGAQSRILFDNPATHTRRWRA